MTNQTPGTTYIKHEVGDITYILRRLKYILETKLDII